MTSKTIIAATPERIAAVAALIGRVHGARTAEDAAGVLSFEGREDYLGFVAAWKAAYAADVAEIRRDKRVRGDGSKSEGERGRASAAREYGRQRARGALALRAAGKELARQARGALAKAA